MKPELEVTGDGSHTLYNPELNEHYHSTFGALTESQFVFIGAGLSAFRENSTVEILEVGFGTGLNAFLSLRESQSRNLLIRYTAIEPYPLPEDVCMKFNYPELIASPDLLPIFMKMHKAPFNMASRLLPCFSLVKIKETLQDVFLGQDQFELVYFDAFGPDAQPEMWTEEVFRKIAFSMKHGAILVTYSVKGSVRRALKAAGFSVQKLPGPPGKREITKAVKL